MKNTDNDESLVICKISRALVDAIVEEYEYNYSQHDNTWNYAINEMSDEVNDIWNKNMTKIRDLSEKLDELLKLQGM